MGSNKTRLRVPSWRILLSGVAVTSTHIIQQYVTDVENLIIKNLSLRLCEKYTNVTFVLKIVRNTPSLA